jgi:hypothetical protein
VCGVWRWVVGVFSLVFREGAGSSRHPIPHKMRPGLFWDGGVLLFRFCLYKYISNDPNETSDDPSPQSLPL